MKPYWLIAYLLIPYASAEPFFNEIMYNPQGNDNNQEFVEVYGIDTLEEYTFGDVTFNDSLELIQACQGCNISLIVEEGYNYSRLNCSIYSAGATIGDNLNNDNDTIYLYHEGVLVDKVSYDDSIGDGNGKSIERTRTGEWQESRAHGGTPCLENSVDNNESYPEPEGGNDIELTPYLDDIVYMYMEYDSLFKIRNLDHVSGEEDEIVVIVAYNITNETTLIEQGIFNKTINSYTTSGTGRYEPEAEGNYTLCGVIIWTSAEDNNPENDYACKDYQVIDPSKIPCNISLGLVIDGLIYDNKQQVKFWNTLTSQEYPYEISYSIRDIFGTEKRNRTTKNTNQKTFTPSLERELNVFFIENKLHFLACNNSMNQTSNTGMIIVKNQQNKISSELEIIEIKPDPARFGETISIKAKITKGDTLKRSIKAYAEKDSKKASDSISISMPKKNTEVEITLPLVLKANCDDTLKEGTYTAVLEGLGRERSMQFRVEGKKPGACTETKNMSKSATRTSDNSSKILSFYTRTKNYKEEIRFYARADLEPGALVLITNRALIPQEKESSGLLNSALGQEQLEQAIKDITSPTLEEVTVYEEKIIFTESSTNHNMDFNITLVEGYNNITLSLLKDSKLLASSSIILNFTKPSESKPRPSIIPKPEQPEKPRIQAEVIYEGQAQKSKKYIKHLLVLLSCIGGVVYLRQKLGFEWIRNRSKRLLTKVTSILTRCSR